jgi:hypothetical protein
MVLFVSVWMDLRMGTRVCKLRMVLHSMYIIIYS